MHDDVKEFAQRVLAEEPDLPPGPVLDVGGYDLNGSLRPLFPDREYVAVDARAGPGVDVVGLAHDYRPGRKFAVVVSTECLEHDPHLDGTVHTMVDLLADNGLLLVTCASPARPEHEPDASPQPGYYLGVSVNKLELYLRAAAGEQIMGWWDRFSVSVARGGLDVQARGRLRRSRGVTP